MEYEGNNIIKLKILKETANPPKRKPPKKTTKQLFILKQSKKSK